MSSWSGEVSLKKLQAHYNFNEQVIRICLNKNCLKGSTKENFKIFNVLPVESSF